MGLEIVVCYAFWGFGVSCSIDKELFCGLDNAKILHDWDNYQASLVDYSYTQYKDGSGTTGYATKMNELKQFFAKANNTKTPSNPDDEV